jgi:esterase/lipase
MHTDLAKPVEQITVPIMLIMLIHAENDTIFPQKYVESIFNRLTCKKKYLFFKNTEHLVMTNNVDEVVPPVAAWLKEVM